MAKNQRKLGFSNELYIQLQSERIRERIEQFGNKLYLEFGGKLFDDRHASRVLPGFEPDSKLRMLACLRDSLEMLIVISARDIERNKVRQDLGITYDEDVLRLRKEFTDRDFLVSGVVITHYNGQQSAKLYGERLSRLGIRTYFHYTIEGYPNNVALIDSEDGFGRNDYIETTRPLVVVTAPGPGSGKMAVCLSQLYQEKKRGVQAGYAKFETFPVWNIPLRHPIQVAYEAATADLNDVNMIDPFHLEAYGEVAVNYNRDIETFPILNALFEGIYETNPYHSPTDMGVNRIAECITDEQVCIDASYHEIIRRYYASLTRFANGLCGEDEIKKQVRLMQQLKITTDYRRTTTAAHERNLETGCSAMAIELNDGTIVCANSSELLGCSAALILNVTKYMAGIDHGLKLIPQELIEPVQYSKVHYLGAKNPRLHSDEVIVSLSVLSRTDVNCRRALEQLPKLRGCQVHSSIMLGEVDRRTFQKLGVDLTCDPVRCV